MPTVNVEIVNEAGMHARPSALFIQIASKYKAEIKLEKDGRVVDGRSILGLMTLAAKKGTKLVIKAEGNDAEEAINDLKELVEAGFNEGKIS